MSTASRSRYADLVRLLLRYGRSDLVVGAQADEFAVGESSSAGTDEGEKAERFARDLEQMGPTYLNICQLLSTRFDLLPPVYTEALTRLQDTVQPVPFEEVREIVESELGGGSRTSSPSSTRSLSRRPRSGRFTARSPARGGMPSSRSSVPMSARRSGMT